MPIVPLSTETIRILGSSQVLTTPVSLVKELIDNGLDARGSAIDVSISANTLDKIEVRDNGSGINESDFGLVGKRGHTSKLRAFEELRRLGGISLGFRGEALGSAVELAEVTLTTKTESDPVATLLKLKVPGGVYSQTKTSHPVGTTVCVQNFLSRLPVRKQTALKEAAKTLLGIKELLKSYALARPHVKLSLKVLKSEKGSWSFAPRPHDGIREVVSQVLGRELASQCVEVTHTSFRSLLDEEAPNSQETITTNNDRDSVFEMHAFLPKADADVTKISKGSFVSVDSRPVSCKRGTLKKIISIYKDHLRASISNTSSYKVKDPFIRLNIICPSGSYDPNVEPAKDDVLFANESALLSLARSLFETLYGEIKANVMTERKEVSKAQSGFDLLMARKPVTAASQDEVTPISRTCSPTAFLSIGQQMQAQTKATLAPAVSEPTESPVYEIPDELPSAGAKEIVAGGASDDGKRKWGFNMARDYEEPEDQTLSRTTSTSQLVPLDLDPEIESPRATITLNPWTIAKLNAPVQKRATNVLLEDAAIEKPPRLANLPTPRQSSEPPSSFALNVDSRDRARYRQRASEEINLDHSYAAWVERQDKGNRVPPTPEDRHSRSHSLPLEHPGGDGRLQTTVTQHRNRARGDFVVARDLPVGDSWTPPPTQSGGRKPRQSGFNKPFKAPKKTGGFVAVNDEQPSQLNDTSLRQSRLTPNARHTPRDDLHLSQQSDTRVLGAAENISHRDLQYSLDFEQQKEDVNKKQRLEARAPASRPSPHQNRYNAAVAVLEAVSNNVAADQDKDKEPFKTSLPDGDPRAYLMRRQNSMSIIENHPEKGMKLKRAKTMPLPLETIPKNSQIQNLVGKISTDMYAICPAVVEVITEDEYMRSGMLGKAFDLEESEVRAVRQCLVERCVELGLVAEGQDLNFDLSGLMKKG